MPAPQFGKTSTAHDDKTTMQDLGAASRFTTQPLGESSRKKRGTLQHSLGEAEIRSQRQRVLRACKHILMRFCRRTIVAAIAGMVRKRGCAAPPPRMVCQIGSGTREKRAEGPNIEHRT